MILDVGCGALAEGDVNLDAFPYDVSQGAGKYWKPKEIKNFVLGDVHYLPFKDNSFSLIIARHVLEHVTNPILAIQEWHRVTSNRVIIVVPSQYVNDLSEAHLFAWNKITLKNLLLKVFSRVEVNYTRDIYYKIEHSVPFVIVNWLSKIGGFYTKILAVCYK